MVDGASINDFPAFRYRGLMVDTARNYLTLDDLKRTLDGMAASKLNVLHWHATDSHSFPLVSPSVPQLSKYGAYSSRQVYTPDDVHEVLRYAKIRGIRVLLEIDAPSHCGNGWQWGKSEELGELAVCVNANPWVRYCLQPPCGQLNPINPNLYPILRRLYNDVIEIFKDTEIFHMGGDEVSFKCWNSIGAIKSWLKSHELPVNETGYLELWSMFQQRALAQWDTAAGHSATNIFLWSSQLTASEVIEQYLDKDRYIIETWVDEDDSLPDELLEKGYRLVMVTKSAWYLDHGFWGNTLYHNWKVAYNNQLPRHKGVLGGEAAMWGELVDGRGLDGRVWPRAAAVGERLWTDPPPSSSTTLPLERLMDHRARLVTRGLDPEAIAPQWCYQNEGLC
ncbi:hypothetical protein AAG570_013941 [Ranatra chinensis]|uniref:beta-N-acetylhexosaminidase n=1 Tax=Ranatra chinensis TaxID=642074 RepID=A0ABD0YEB7_9HEMI